MKDSQNKHHLAYVISEYSKENESFEVDGVKISVNLDMTHFAQINIELQNVEFTNKDTLIERTFYCDSFYEFLYYIRKMNMLITCEKSVLMYIEK